VIIGPADIQTVTEQITATWKRIQQRDFYTGCGKPECHWCNFVKTNDLAVALHDISGEDETDEAPTQPAEL
jgi:DNA helicase-2/ATP-dependent DNA helicase PcrA